MKKPILSIDNLFINRGAHFNLQVEKLHLQAGTLLCVTGPNGSGKSTLLTSMAGLLKPDGGVITIAGKSLTRHLRETKAKIGYVPDDEDWFIRELSAREYLRLLGNIYSDVKIRANIQSRISQLSEQLYFSQLDTPLDQLSHGNKKKVQLIAGLMHSPLIIVIDELRNGLDPLAIIAAENILRQEARRGACIVAATHDLWWAERISDEVLMLKDGRVRIHQTTSSICKAFGSFEKAFMREASATTA